MLFFSFIFTIVPISEEEKLCSLCSNFNITNEKSIYRLYMLMHNPDFYSTNISNGNFLKNYLLAELSVSNTESLLYNIISFQVSSNLNYVTPPFLIPYIIYIRENNFIIDISRASYYYVPTIFSIYIETSKKLKDIFKYNILDECDYEYDVILYFIEVEVENKIMFVFYKNNKFYSIIKNGEVFFTYYDEDYLNMPLKLILVKSRN